MKVEKEDKKSANWFKYDFRHYSWYVAILIVLYSFHFSKLGDFLEGEITQKIEFRARESLNLAPKIDPRLKIYAFDDYAVRKISRDELKLENWSQIIHTISKSNPKLIVIDKEFGVINSDENFDSLKKSLSTSVPVYVGSHTKKALVSVLPTEKTSRSLNLSRPEYDLNKSLLHKNTNYDWLNILDHETFGPKSMLRDYFHGVGHINYEFIGRIEPFRRISESKVIPHMTLLTADSLKISDHEIIVDHYPVQLDEHFLIPINFPSVDELFSNTKSIYPVYKRAKENRIHSKINAGDVVLLLPLFFTGNTDMGLTPIGRIPRGLVIASLLNSILKQEWLHPVNIAPYLIPVSALIGAGFGLFLSPLWFWVATVLSSIIVFIGSLAFFCFMGLMLPWLVFIVSSVLSGVIFFSIKMSRQNRVSQAYEVALSGLVSRNSLEQLIKNHEAISREPSEQMITIMFLDMVSFSRMAQDTDPKIVFSRLKSTMGSFSAFVHKYGGVVDKTMGDGMLCFFGYNYIGGKTSDNHADQAIACAKELQIEHAKSSLLKLKDDEPIIPVRIGINSAKVYIGDLGDKDRIDFTLIGSGVNYAQRLEAACEPFSILMSEESLQFAHDFHLGMPSIRKRQIKIKHQKKLVDAMELLPFFDHNDILEQCKTVFYQKDPSRDRSTRWPVQSSKEIILNTSLGEAGLVNFSRSGFAFHFKLGYSNGEVFTLNLHLFSKMIADFLETNQIPVISCEVRWCVSEGAKKLHGIRIINLSEKEKEVVYEALKEAVK